MSKEEAAKKRLKVGDVFGLDYTPPQNLSRQIRRFFGWRVFNIKPDGTPQLLEEFQERRKVRWSRAVEHLGDLWEEFGDNVRFMTQGDNEAIFRNSKGEPRLRAAFEIASGEGSFFGRRVWGEANRAYSTSEAWVHSPIRNAGMSREGKETLHQPCCVVDAPELKGFT